MVRLLDGERVPHGVVVVQHVFKRQPRGVEHGDPAIAGAADGRRLRAGEATEADGVCAYMECTRRCAM